MIASRAWRATALAALAVVCAAPSTASAQPLKSVAIVQTGTYLALDVAGGSTAAGAKVIMWYITGAANQRWNLVTRSDGKQQVVSQKSGMCLTTNGIAGAQLYQWTCNGGPGQAWDGDLHGYLSRYVGVLSNPGTGLVVDVQGAGRWAGTAVIGWYANGGSNQGFQYLQLA